MNNGVKLNDKHSVKDWDLVMQKKIIAPPEPKKFIIEVEGGDGVIDLSTELTGGDIKYKTRVITIPLVKISEEGESEKFKSAFMDAYHGQMIDVTFDDDPDYYYHGRCVVSYSLVNAYVCELLLTIEANPYKHRLNKTTLTKHIEGSAIMTYLNLRKWVTPVFDSTSDFTIEFEQRVYTIGQGSYVLPDIQFKPGENIIKYTGTGYITVSYLEGAL